MVPVELNYDKCYYLVPICVVPKLYSKPTVFDFYQSSGFYIFQCINTSIRNALVKNNSIFA